MKHGENLSNLQYFCQMIFGNGSINMHTQFILIAQENYVWGHSFILLSLLKKSILLLALTQNIQFGIRFSCEFQIIVTFE